MQREAPTEVALPDERLKGLPSVFCILWEAFERYPQAAVSFIQNIAFMISFLD